MTELVVPRGAAARIAAETRLAGRERAETGGFLLAPHDGPVAVLALAGVRGVRRERDLFQVGSLALAALFEWTEDHDLTVVAQWHSHRRDAFLSLTDLQHGFNVPGFYTAVVPNYAAPSADPADWGWWVFDGGAWTPVPPAAHHELDHAVVTFEEGGVHDG
jgi:hypothetical protein